MRDAFDEVTSPARRRPTILVVDDAPDNLRLLVKLLKQRNYGVRPVPNGALALRAAAEDPPDLVLLDVNMPEMDGYEVCRRLKADPDLRDVPVIFLSAALEPLDKVRAFGAGGVDYVTKPFQIDEMAARIDTHLKLRALRMQLLARNRDLQTTNEKLEELERVRDQLTQMIGHDMRSPLTVVLTHLRLALQDSSQLSGDARMDIAMALESGHALMRMINDLIDVGRLKSARMPVRLEVHDLTELVGEAVQSMEVLLQALDLRIEAPADAAFAMCDRDLVRRVLVNLLANAHSVLPDGGRVQIGVVRQEASWRVDVRDEGPGIDAQHLERIFDQFTQIDLDKSRRRGPSSGLGLTFCSHALAAMNGRIGVESQPGEGATFWFALPVP